MTTGKLKNDLDDSFQTALPSPLRQHIFITLLLIFLVALGARLLVWQHNGSDIAQVMTGLTAGYRDDARYLISGNWRLFLRGPEPPTNANILAHPPGYSIMMAAIFPLFGESDAAMRVVQLTCDALAAVMIFLLCLELLPKAVAVIAGLLVALSPQLAFNSLLLLPDSLSVLPVLLCVYLIVRASRKRSPVFSLGMAGACLGVSCWLRPNALLLPLFMAAFIPFFFPRGQGLRRTLLFIGATLLFIAPITLRNLIVFERFIPLSLGSGVTFIEGIADYDEEKQTGLPKTDMEVLRWEAELSGRAEYAGSLYNPDGIERERERVARGLSAVRARPFWFLTVMLRRAASMLRLERVPAISGSPLTLGATATAATGQPSSAARLLRYPGILLKSVQKLFVTAIMLPLFLIGVFLLARRHGKRICVSLLVVPVYYLCVQSLLHTEYRYVIAIQYFLLIFVAYTLYRASIALRQLLGQRPRI